MRTLRLEGTYHDDIGSEDVVWIIASSTRARWQGRYEITATIRSVEVNGANFDGLELMVPSDVSGPRGPRTAMEVTGRHVRAAGERLDVQRLRVLPVDPVAVANSTYLRPKLFATARPRSR